MRKRTRTAKGSQLLNDEQFEEYMSMSANETSIVDNSGKLNCTESQVQKNTEGSSASSCNEVVDKTSITASTEDRTEVAVEESNTSDDVESMLTQRTPEVPPDQVNKTPRVDSRTPVVSCDSSTLGAISTGRASRGNSVNLMLELEKAAESENREKDDIENSESDHAATICEKENASLEVDSNNLNDAVFLNSLYELHLYHQSNINECGTSGSEKLEKLEKLETKIDKQKKIIETLVYEKKALEMKVEEYAKNMFQKEQKMKIMADRVEQLENSNNYRKEVARLEEVAEKREGDLRILKEELTGVKKINIQKEDEKHKARKELEASMKRELNMTEELEKSNIKMKELEVELANGKEKVAILEENKTFLLNENTILKNNAKVLNTKKPINEKDQPLNDHSLGKELDVVVMNKELCSLRKELKMFKKFTFEKLDELSGRGVSSSSYSSSCDDVESGEESEGAPIPQKKKTPPQPPKETTPPRRKPGNDSGNQVNIEAPTVTLRYEGNNPTTAATSPDELGRTIKLVPGSQSYSDKVRGRTASPESSDFNDEEKASKIRGIKARRQLRENKTLIFSDSITRDITRQRRSFDEKCSKTNVAFHEFKGKKASDIVKYMIPHLDEEQPSSVVFIAGGNDLPSKDIPFAEIKKIANCVVEGGLLCRGEYGVNDIYISSIMPRSHSEFQGNRHCLNKMLREMCREYNLIFIDNSNIVLSTHGHHDGVHLNVEGSELLRENLLNVLNS